MITLGGNPDGYVIMPATYEAGQTGPFIISVSTDVDFTVTSDAQWSNLAMRTVIWFIDVAGWIDNKWLSFCDQLTARA